MIRRKPQWERRRSGLYVPPLIGRLLPRVPAMCMSPWYPCGKPCEGCEHCDGAIPDSFQVVIAGLANDTCNYCADLNGTYVVTWDDTFMPGYCFWVYALPSEICTVAYVSVSMYKIGAQYRVVANLRKASDYTMGWYVDIGETKPDCKTFSGLALTTHFYAYFPCDDSLSTCNVTAL